MSKRMKPLQGKVRAKASDDIKRFGELKIHIAKPISANTKYIAVGTAGFRGGRENQTMKVHIAVITASAPRDIHPTRYSPWKKATAILVGEMSRITAELTRPAHYRQL